MFSGTSTTFAETVSLLGHLTGRKILCRTAPAWLISPLVNLMDNFHGILPFRLPVTNEGLTILKWDLRFEDSAAVYGMGIEKTDLGTTMADMVKWMHASGRIPAKIAGRLAV
jgi:phosphoribosylamine-glycine ligase